MKNRIYEEMKAKYQPDYKWWDNERSNQRHKEMFWGDGRREYQEAVLLAKRDYVRLFPERNDVRIGDVRECVDCLIPNEKGIGVCLGCVYAGGDSMHRDTIKSRSFLQTKEIERLKAGRKNDYTKHEKILKLNRKLKTDNEAQKSDLEKCYSYLNQYDLLSDIVEINSLSDSEKEGLEYKKQLETDGKKELRTMKNELFLGLIVGAILSLMLTFGLISIF